MWQVKTYFTGEVAAAFSLKKHALEFSIRELPGSTVEEEKENE